MIKNQSPALQCSWECPTARCPFTYTYEICNAGTQFSFAMQGLSSEFEAPGQYRMEFEEVCGLSVGMVVYYVMYNVDAYASIACTSAETVELVCICHQLAKNGTLLAFSKVSCLAP